MRVVVRPAAAADIENAQHWYDNRRRGLGLEFLEAVDGALAAIAEKPLLHPLVGRDTRRALLRRFPYGIYYRVYPDAILVIACMHGRRSARRWRSRR